MADYGIRKYRLGSARLNRALLEGFAVEGEDLRTCESPTGAHRVFFPGLDSAEKISEAAAFEPMMGSMAFSMVLVRVAEGAEAKSVAESMKAGIDTRKWICVEANDLKVAGFGDVVMLIMVNSDSGMTVQSFVDAFAKVAGFQPEFVI